jgi:hypothetical protein
VHKSIVRKSEFKMTSAWYRIRDLFRPSAKRKTTSAYVFAPTRLIYAQQHACPQRRRCILRNMSAISCSITRMTQPKITRFSQNFTTGTSDAFRHLRQKHYETKLQDVSNRKSENIHQPSYALITLAPRIITIMARFTDLPVELLTRVMRLCGDLKTVLRLSSACKTAQQVWFGNTLTIVRTMLPFTKSQLIDFVVLSRIEARIDVCYVQFCPCACETNFDFRPACYYIHKGLNCLLPRSDFRQPFPIATAVT